MSFIFSPNTEGQYRILTFNHFLLLLHLWRMTFICISHSISILGTSCNFPCQKYESGSNFVFLISLLLILQLVESTCIYDLFLGFFWIIIFVSISYILIERWAFLPCLSAKFHPKCLLYQMSWSQSFFCHRNESTKVSLC